MLRLVPGALEILITFVIIVSVLLLHSRQTSITGHFPNTGWSLICSAHTVFYTWHAYPIFIQLTLRLIFIGDAGEINPPYPPKAILFLIVHDLFLSITLPVTLLYFSSCLSCFRVCVYLFTSLLNQKLAEGRDCPGNCHTQCEGHCKDNAREPVFNPRPAPLFKFSVSRSYILNWPW